MVKVIINADDFGKTKERNLAILDSFNKNLISSSTIMANMGRFNEAIEMINEHNLNGKIGIHINISEGKPLTDKIKQCGFFCDENGNFRNEPYAIKRLLRKLTKNEIDALRLELDAQIQKCVDHGVKLTHADSHNHKHNELYMLMVLPSILKAYNIDKIRVARTMHPNKVSFGYLYKKFCNLYLRNIAKLSVVDSLIVTEDIDQLHNQNQSIELMCHLYYKNSEVMDSDRKLSEIIQSLKKKMKMEMVSYNELSN